MRPGLKDGCRRPDDQDIDGISAEIPLVGFRCLRQTSSSGGPAAELQQLDALSTGASKGRLAGLAALLCNN